LMYFDVITIGTATRDAFVRSKDFHVDNDRHVLGGKGLVMPLGAKLEIEKIVFSTGGGATNTAVTFAKQGLKTAAISVVGNDVSGEAIIQELKEDKVNTDFIVRRKELPTAYSILLHPEGGERTVLVYRGASENLSSKDIPCKKIKTKWFYISSLAGNIGLLQNLVEFARKKKIKIAYNPGGKELKQRKKLLPILKHIDILTVDRSEAALITGVSYKNERKIFQKWDKMSPGINVMTDARNGLWVSDGKYLYKAGIYKERAVIDRTGAGDAFGSGFLSGIFHKIPNPKIRLLGEFQGFARRKQRHLLPTQISKLTIEDIKYAIRLGSANATSKVEGIGAKFGLLTKKQFETQKRWKNLLIKVAKL